MVEFKSAPSNKRLMFRKAKVSKKPKPAKASLAQTKKTKKPVVRKFAKLLMPALKMTKLTGGKKTAAPKTALQFMKDAITSVQQEVNTSTKKASLIQAATAVGLVGEAVRVAAAIVIMLIVLIFLIWGIVRSGQEMAASNGDWSASKLYFWVMIGSTALYIILNIVVLSYVPIATACAWFSTSCSDDDGDGATVVKPDADPDNSALEAWHGMSGFVGIVGVQFCGISVLIMAIIALARLGMKKK